MTEAAAGTYIIQGLKISLGILQDVSSMLPPPAPNIFSLAQRIVTLVEVRAAGGYAQETVFLTRILDHPGERGAM